jgi:hypothetical protein
MPRGGDRHATDAGRRQTQPTFRPLLETRASLFRKYRKPSGTGSSQLSVGEINSSRAPTVPAPPFCYHLRLPGQTRFSLLTTMRNGMTGEVHEMQQAGHDQQDPGLVHVSFALAVPAVISATITLLG